MYFFIFTIGLTSALNCGFPGVNHRASIEPRQEQYENCDTVTYTCTEGYQLRGNATIECLATEQEAFWTDEPPTCDKNFAYKMITTQENEKDDDKIKAVVDQDVTTCYKGSKKVSNKTIWIQDLRYLRNVSSVYVYLRSAHVSTTLNNMDIAIYISNNIHNKDEIEVLCGQYKKTNANFTEFETEIHCDKGPITGRFILITDQRREYPKKMFPICLCEVQIFSPVPDNEPCGEPGLPLNSQRVYATPGRIQYIADDDYQIKPDTSYIRVCESGRWSGKTPQSVPKHQSTTTVTSAINNSTVRSQTSTDLFIITSTTTSGTVSGRSLNNATCDNDSAIMKNPLKKCLDADCKKNNVVTSSTNSIMYTGGGIVLAVVVLGSIVMGLRCKRKRGIDIEMNRRRQFVMDANPTKLTTLVALINKQEVTSGNPIDQPN